MSALTDLILKEGWRPVGSAVAIALLFALADLELFSFLALSAAGLLVWTYRQPVRTVAHFEKGSITSPCDGTVTAIETAADGSVIVEIETGCLDASLVTMPFDGSVKNSEVVRGARLPRKSTLAESLNEHGSLLFENDQGQRIGMTLTLFRSAAALVLENAGNGVHRLRGTRCGVMVQGVTRLRFPESTRVAVNPGEKVRATETLLGYMG